MFYDGKKLREVFLKAKKNRYGIIASNVAFDFIIRPLVWGYERQNSDGLLQMSSGACKYAAGESQDIYGGAKIISAMVKNIASLTNNSGVGLHIDHATPNYFEFIKFCIENELVSSVMIDASKENLAENIRITKEVVELAHRHGILVEGEIGYIKGSEDEIISEDELYTHPEEALEYVTKTKVDLFAASVGTNHGVSKGKAIVLRFDLVKEIDELLIKNGVETGLVLHGASGLTLEQHREAIKNGVVKINKDTQYQMDAAEAVQAFWEKEKYAIVCPEGTNHEDYIPDKNKFDPRKWLVKAENAIGKSVEEMIMMVKSNGQAVGKS
ncbi:MAG: class II fructose-bisphosphate aldolase [Candidatus Cloacimonetes bacterium]|nr:class II fructose-bisphosphate aldolase [Candidatus Cloacimonadota bacterium]